MRFLRNAVSLAAVLTMLALVPSGALAKSCSGGYIHATIGGAQKCLRRGEYCARRYASQYRRYGFVCVWKTGDYHLEPR